MDHGYFLDRVSAYHDRDLPPQELALMEEHLRDCAECQALLKRFEQLDALVDQKAELAGSDYWEQAARKIQQRIAQGEQGGVTDIRPSRRSWALGWKVMAAAASLVLLGYIGMHKDDIFGPVKQELSAPPPAEKSVIGQDTRSIPPSNDTTGIDRVAVEDAVRKEIAVQPRQKRSDHTETKSTQAAKDEKISPAVQKPLPVPSADALVEKEVAMEDQPAKVVEKLATEGQQDLGVRIVDSQTLSKAAKALAPTTSAEAGGSNAMAHADQQVDLASLRHERDSLTTLLANMDKVKGKLQLPTALDQGLVSREKKAEPKRRDIERQLLETSYQLLINSPDSSECTIARALLEKVASDSTSANRDLAFRLLGQAANH